MDIGKLPNDLLARLLSKVDRDRSGRVVVGPKVGEDAAVIDMGQRLLVATSDPITFASDLIGWYAVHVNANDVACMGAKPCWFLATILLPQGSSEELAGSIFDQILDACQTMQIELVGGHTEVTYRLERPLVVGTMLGEVERERLVTGSGARPGDALILTKGIAIEGTAVLAQEAAPELRRLGVSQATIDEAKGYIFDPGISVVREALAASAAGGVHTMHDPTEGGLATALYELAAASQVGLHVEEATIDVLPATRAIAKAVGLELLGLLASGALLLVVAPRDADTVLAALESAHVDARRIGVVVNREEGVIMERQRKRIPAPRLARDEVARFLDSTGASAGPDRYRGSVLDSGKEVGDNRE